MWPHTTTCLSCNNNNSERNLINKILNRFVVVVVVALLPFALFDLVAAGVFGSVADNLSQLWYCAGKQRLEEEENKMKNRLIPAMFCCCC